MSPTVCSHAEVTMINARGILLYVKEKEYYLPYDRFPWFKDAKVSDVLAVSMPDSESLRWEAMDIDLELEVWFILNVIRLPLPNLSVLFYCR